ncbi:MAG: PIG-L family deacetylase, partial [Lachnospiraceae bacterium]|nr:PIG-L family deacetylase [Lachnospiraceae bacterium]
MSILSFIIKKAAPVPKIENFDSYLFVGPHPDDIEIGAGATAAKLAAAGKKVTFLVCLDGRFGLENAGASMTPEKLTGIRHDEAVRSAAALGVTDVRFLGLCDGGFYKTGLEWENSGDFQGQAAGEPGDTLFSSIARIIGEVKPDVVFAPDPDVISECHTDHKNVGECVKRLAFFAPFKEIMGRYGAEPAEVKAVAFYMTSRVNRTVKTKGLLKKQLDALFS